jgi:cephalosporin hydroxylase
MAHGLWDGPPVTRAGQVARTLLPKAAADRLAFTLNTYRSYRRMKRDLSHLRKQYAACHSLDQQVDLIRAHKVFGAIQQHTEIARLLQLLQQNPPKFVCEIGSASGGTLFMFAQVCHPDALLVSVDLDLSFERCLLHPRFARRQQKIVPIRGDSRAPQTIDRVRAVLRGHPLDLLFIDGDHSYAGVKADFENYRPLVRPGGLVVFHDIVRDFGSRYGTPTTSYTGGVPDFWQQIKSAHKTSEFIEDPQQDGYGIGIAHL